MLVTCLITVGPKSLLGAVLHIRQSSCTKKPFITTTIIVIIKKKKSKKQNKKQRGNDVNHQFHLLPNARLFPSCSPALTQTLLLTLSESPNLTGVLFFLSFSGGSGNAFLPHVIVIEINSQQTVCRSNRLWRYKLLIF